MDTCLQRRDVGSRGVPLLSTPGPTGPERVVPTQKGTVAQEKVPLDLPASVPETSEMEPQPEEAQPEDAGRHTGRVHRSETLWMLDGRRCLLPGVFLDLEAGTKNSGLA